ncbi:hypothetical protein C1H46_024814 [Malus baccata]|uniref:Uncharacterized protein n=1 Tax=Malus baccata TaxID=106549 RepID=A0A540LTP5_MALBA|nr:hypothetical protein C1H46_024814 [Malus baccata]
MIERLREKKKDGETEGEGWTERLREKDRRTERLRERRIEIEADGEGWTDDGETEGEKERLRVWCVRVWSVRVLQRRRD